MVTSICANPSDIKYRGAKMFLIKCFYFDNLKLKAVKPIFHIEQNQLLALLIKISGKTPGDLYGF